MDIKDFVLYFSKVEICNLEVLEAGRIDIKIWIQTKKLSDDDDSKMNWVTKLHESRWQRGTSAGGCPNFKDSFWQNPQFLLELDETDDNPDDDDEGCTFIASLLQKNPKRREKKEELLTIG